MTRFACMARVLPAVALVLLGQVAVAQTAPAQSPGQMLTQARPKAMEQVLLSARSQDPFLRANSIEAIQPVVERARPMAQLGLKDPHPAVRFSAAVTIGKLRLKGAEAAIANVIKDPDPNVRAGALYAATQLGMSADVSELASFMASPDAGVRSNAAMLLGLMNDRGAVPMMRELGQLPLSRRMAPARHAVYRVQLAEAMVQLGDEQALEGIRAGAYSSYDEVRILSVQAMGRLGDQPMVPALQRIQAQAPLQLQVAAAHALAQLGANPNLSTVLKAANYTAEDALRDAQEMAKRGMDGRDAAFLGNLLHDPAARESMAATVRSSAAPVLGMLNNPTATSKLVAMLDDRSEQVRLTAAAAVLRGRPAGAVAQH